jgi:hypothetical protein
MLGIRKVDLNYCNKIDTEAFRTTLWRVITGSDQRRYWNVIRSTKFKHFVWKFAHAMVNDNDNQAETQIVEC